MYSKRQAMHTQKSHRKERGRQDRPPHCPESLATKKVHRVVLVLLPEVNRSGWYNYPNGPNSSSKGGQYSFINGHDHRALFKRFLRYNNRNMAVSAKEQSTYCNIMEGRPCRAACFDWDFREVAFTGPAKREGIFNERQRFVKMIKNLNFTIYPSEKEVKVTRNLPKRNFIKELKKFKNLCVSEPCGCILLSISSHGVIVKMNDQIDSGDFETYEDFILTHPEPDENEFSENYVDERVSVKEIIDVFTDKGLRNIPKIFLIQACRNRFHAANQDSGVDIGFDVCVVRDNGEDEPLPQSHLRVPPAPPGPNIAYSPPYLENSVIVFSTPFGYSAGAMSNFGSHVWCVLEETLKDMEPVNGSINLLDWLKKTNGNLAKDEDFKIKDNLKYKPLLSISHTLTKQILLKLQRD